VAADAPVVPSLTPEPLMPDALTPDALIPDTTSATHNMFRQFGRYLGVAFILSFVALFGAIVDSPDVVPLWWTVVVVLAIHGTAVVMFAASFQRSDITWVVWSGRALCIAYAITVATWPLVWNGNLVDAGYGMWFTQFNGFAAATATLVWRVRWSLPYLVYVVVSVQFVNEAVRTASHNSEVLTDIAWSFCICAMPYAFVVAAIRSVHVLDDTRAQSAQAAADSARTVARAEERARFDALTHDRIMSTLLTAARTPMSNELVLQAAGALTKLDVLEATGRSGPSPMDAAAAIREISSGVNDVDATIAVRSEIPTHTVTRYPSPVVTAIAEAAAEAVRNSIRHAGLGSTRTVHVVAGDEQLTVDVVDDGVGFDTAAIGLDRLGVADSIRGRMTQIAGGSAEVTSGHGRGTSIRLRWRRP
jgi:hypothetical protein